MTHTKSEILEACKAVSAFVESPAEIVCEAIALLDAIDAATAPTEVDAKDAPRKYPYADNFDGMPELRCESERARKASGPDGNRRGCWMLVSADGQQEAYYSERPDWPGARAPGWTEHRLVEILPGERVCRPEPVGYALKDKDGETRILRIGIPSERECQTVVDHWDCECPGAAPHTLVPLYEESDT